MAGAICWLRTWEDRAEAGSGLEGCSSGLSAEAIRWKTFPGSTRSEESCVASCRSLPRKTSRCRSRGMAVFWVSREDLCDEELEALDGERGPHEEVEAAAVDGLDSDIYWVFFIAFHADNQKLLC